jgi:OOP family OmpA-OmpF porin
MELMLGKSCTCSLIATLIALALLASPRPAQAKDFRPDWELGGFVGAHWFNQVNELGVPDVEPWPNSPRSRAIIGLRLGFEFVPKLSLEFEGGLMPTVARKHGDLDLLVITYRGHVMYRFLNGVFQPFVLAGYGGYTMRTTNTSIMSNDTDSAAHFGVGAKFQLGHDWGIRLDGRLMLPPSSVPDSKATLDWEALVGFYVQLGKGPKDTDKDGIPDDKDKCPTEPGPKENDGCPDKDTDNDGVVDRLDQCPTTPAGAYPDANRPGCPEADSDGDGLVDSKDKCPKEPAGPNPDPKKPGCPVRDTDGDGILDPDDKCPTEPGPKENGGCPDKDGDNDGVVDRLDKCPTQPGPKENDGCPLPEAIKKFTGKIEGITFAVNSAKILPKSFKVLDAAVKVLKEFERLPLTIEGHTSSEGKREKNMELSKARAESVKAYMVSKGVAAGRLHSIGYGPDKPVADNKTAKGKAANRRIEFKIQAQ